MKLVVTRLAAMAGVVVLTVGLPAMAGAAYGSSQPPRARAQLSGLARLDGLAKAVLFPAAATASRGSLGGVDLRARADGWAVGNRCARRCSAEDTLIEHWNGRRWSRVPSPNVSRLQTLSAVRATSANDAWAVGLYITTKNYVVRTLIEHWNGHRWSRVPSPNPNASLKDGFNLLDSVSVVSARDAWAAGYFQHGNALRPLLLHWNGARWSAVPSPYRSMVSGLTSVTATSARNAWAVGVYGSNGNYMLLMHWNGVRWSLVPGLRVEGWLTGVTAVSARDIWATGGSCPAHCQRQTASSRTLILHWNGVRWTRMASPDPARQDSLTAVTAVAATDAWAVGTGCDAAQCQPAFADTGGQNLLLHWNGVRWAAVAGPKLGRGIARLGGVSVLSAGRAAAAGVFCSGLCGSGSSMRPLILGWNGRRWQASAG